MANVRALSLQRRQSRSMEAQEFARYNADWERAWAQTIRLAPTDRNGSRLLLEARGDYPNSPHLARRWLQLQRITAQMYGGHSWAGEWMEFPCGRGGRFMPLNGRVGLGEALTGNLERILGEGKKRHWPHPRQGRQDAWAGFVLLHELTHGIGSRDVSEWRDHWRSLGWLVPREAGLRTARDVIRASYFYEAHIDLAAEVFFRPWLELLGIAGAASMAKCVESRGGYRRGRIFVRGFLETISYELRQPLPDLLADMVRHGTSPLHYLDILERLARARGITTPLSALTIAGAPAHLPRRLMALACSEFNQQTGLPGERCYYEDVTAGRELAHRLIRLVDLAGHEPEAAKAEIDSLAPRQEDEAIVTMRWLSGRPRPEQHAFLWALLGDRSDAIERVDEWKVLLEAPERWSTPALDEPASIRNFLLAQRYSRLRKLEGVVDAIAQHGDPVAHNVLRGLGAPTPTPRAAAQLA